MGFGRPDEGSGDQTTASTRRVFADTGAWIAILKRNDRDHERAVSHYSSLLEEGSRLLTTNYVVDEAATRLRYDTGLSSALAFRDLVDRATATKRLRVTWVDRALEREGWAILERYADVKLSLTDAVSAAAARRAKLTEVFGFDAEFRALGFDVQPAR